MGTYINGHRDARLIQIEKAKYVRFFGKKSFSERSHEFKAV